MPSNRFVCPIIAERAMVNKAEESYKVNKDFFFSNLNIKNNVRRGIFSNFEMCCILEDTDNNFCLGHFLAY